MVKRGCRVEMKALPSEPKAASVLTKVDEELLYAKKEIERAPIVYDDPELYAPLFQTFQLLRGPFTLLNGIPNSARTPLKLYAMQMFLRGYLFVEGCLLPETNIRMPKSHSEILEESRFHRDQSLPSLQETCMVE
ncbi:hypothetical protein HPP92_026168, partial [Vanilla planifolia]